MTTYPSAVDYTLALQHPDTAFADADLRSATFAQGLLGPYGIAGSSAVVFHGTIAGHDYALRCYTREDASTPERYAALDSFVASSGLTRYIGTVTWYKQEIKVIGARWPVLRMEWIAGQQLNEYVGYLAESGNSAALRTLAGRWLEFVSELQRVRFAHGDLQHGNILVDRQGHLRLVDFDSVWIPPLQGHAAPTESGHPSYQLQAGSVRSRWGPYMDTFSGLVIYLALTALAKDPGLWPRFNNGDNLLFERGDFVLPYDTEVWNHLAGLSDPDIDKIVLKLKACCVPGWVASKSLPDMLKPTWWEAQGGSAPMATAWTALTATAGTAPAAATTPTGTPSSAAGTAPGTVPPPPQWHIPSISSQPTAPAGSLPPPPQVPYQSTVAAQSARTPFGGARQPGKPGTAGSGGSWWAQQQGNAPAGTIKSTPMMPNKNPPSNSSRAPLGGLVAVAGIIAFIALVAAHHALRGTALGLVLVVIGIVIAKSKSRT